jgi:flagellin
LVLEQPEGYGIGIENFASSVTGSTIQMTHMDFNTTDTGTPATLTDGGNDSNGFTGTVQLASTQPFTYEWHGTTTNSSLAALSTVDISTRFGATNSLGIADAALQQVATMRANMGGLQSRFETAAAGLAVSVEDLSASRSRIEDADFAQETANLSQAQILQQASTAMVAQANQLQQQVLQLLR